MNRLKALARLCALREGTARRISRERPFPVSDKPAVLIPILMAGEAPSLFALGIGDGYGPVSVHVCVNPRNRELQYQMLEGAAARLTPILNVWERDPSMMPQVITPSFDGQRLYLAVIDRMAFLPTNPSLRALGRRMYWLMREFERPDSAALLDMPSALSQLYATGQDDIADMHLAAFLEWLKPADGNIIARVQEAEALSVSTATDPVFDNEILVPLFDAYTAAMNADDQRAAAENEAEIRRFMTDEIERRYELVTQALTIVRSFPGSALADEIQALVRKRFDRNQDYVSNDEARISRGFHGTAATMEFLGREIIMDRLEALSVRSVSAASGKARLSGTMVEGRIVEAYETPVPRKTIYEYDVHTPQEILAIRERDRLVLLNTDEFKFRVTDVQLAPQGGSIISLQMIKGMRNPTKPRNGQSVVLMPPLADSFQIGRTMGMSKERLDVLIQRQPVQGTAPVRHDLLSTMSRLRGR